MNQGGERPDPDALLSLVQQQQARARRGRLKIWLGAAPGVGKTFAMLTAARRRRLQGLEVVVGWLDTHGRAETAALLQGLECQPRRQVPYEGRVLEEFDVEAVLQRRPALVLVDELAHSNVPGARFGKRWQDVEALCAAGIDVETTLNVQHIESLVDLVQQVTGVRVRETVPDGVVDGADEVVMVDLAPDALLERLRQGKVYRAAVADQALDGFFRKSNLTALREMALRRTASWVDSQLQSLRHEQGVQRIWGTADRVLVAVGPSPLSARLVRAAHRTAVGLRAELFAVYVETPHRELSPLQRARVTEHLRLAESLGARTASISGEHAAATIIGFAKEHDIARIVVGKSGRPRWQEALFGSLTTELIRDSGEIDVHVVRGPDEPVVDERTALVAPDEGPDEADAAPDGAPARTTRRWSAVDLAWMLGLSAVSIGAAELIYAPGDLATEAMVLILGIVLISLRCPRSLALVAVFVNAGAFNFLFTEPRFSFAIADPGYVVAFCVMLVLGVLLTTLMQRIRDGTASAQQREHEVAALYSLVRELADASTEAAVAQTLVRHLRDVVGGELVLLAPQGGVIADPGCVVASHGVPDWVGPAEFGLARWCFDQGRAAGAGTDHLPGSKALFLPMSGQRGRKGVLGCRARSAAVVLEPRRRALVATSLEQAALALERLQSRDTQLRDREAAETERLRSTLLASVSHDLRTPLASITGAASSLLDDGAELAVGARRELLTGILQESRRLNDLIANLLFATRLDAGMVTLRREWTSLEEVVGAAVRRARPQLGMRPLQVVVAPGLPLVEADAVLLEQAVFLLLDNAAQHTPTAAPVRVVAFGDDLHVGIEVEDGGPGVAPELRARLFTRFERGARSGGMGLGLAIGAAIAKAHGGALELRPDHGAGAVFRLSLPRPRHQPTPPHDDRDDPDETQDGGGDGGEAQPRRAP